MNLIQEIVEAANGKGYWGEHGWIETAKCFEAGPWFYRLNAALAAAADMDKRITELRHNEVGLTGDDEAQERFRKLFYSEQWEQK